MIGKPAAFDLTVVSPLNSNTLNEVGATGESAARKAEACKHNANDHKCREPGWVCIPLAVETYGCWGEEAQSSVSRLAARLALQLQCSKPKAIITSIYQRLDPSPTFPHRVRILLSSQQSSPPVSGCSSCFLQLSVVPSPRLGLHLVSMSIRFAIRWWLGLDTFSRSMCPFCPDTAFAIDPWIPML